MSARPLQHQEQDGQGLSSPTSKCSGQALSRFLSSLGVWVTEG